jgi:hypothetical protein
MAGTTVFVALSLATLLAGQNGQGASARDQSGANLTPQIEIGARTYSGERPVASALSGVGDVVTGTVWIDSSGCGVGSASGGNASVRAGTPGPSAVRWTYTGHIVDRAAGGVVAEIEWERNSVNYGDLPKSTKRVNLRLGESVVIDELTPKAPDNLCGASAMRLEASLVVPASRGFRPSGGAGAGGRGTMVSGAGAGTGSGRGFAPPSTRTSGASGGGSGAGAGSGGAGAGGGGSSGNGAAAGPVEDLRVRAMAMRDFVQLMAAVQGQGVGAAASPVGRGNDLLGSMRPVQGASYDAEVWLVHTPTGGQEETQRVEVHVDSDGQAFRFPDITITTPRGPARIEVAAMLRPVANANGDVMLTVAIVRRIDGPDNSVTGGSTKVIPLPSSADIISFELPDTHGTTFDVLNGHQLSVRVKIKRTPGILSQN